MVHLLPNLPNLPSPLRRAEHGRSAEPSRTPSAGSQDSPTSLPVRCRSPLVQWHASAHRPISRCTRNSPGERVPNSLPTPTRRGGTQFPPPTYPERGYPISSAYLPGERVPSAVWQLPCSSPLLLPPSAPGNAPSPFPSLNPSPPRKKIKTPAPRRNKTTRSRIFPAHETLPTPACSRKTTGLPMASGWRG